MVLQLTARHCESAEGCACWQVMVSDEEPQENAVKRFRREVMNAGLTLEVCSQLLRSRFQASWLLLGWELARPGRCACPWQSRT